MRRMLWDTASQLPRNFRPRRQPRNACCATIGTKFLAAWEVPHSSSYELLSAVPLDAPNLRCQAPWPSRPHRPSPTPVPRFTSSSHHTAIHRPGSPGSGGGGGGPPSCQSALHLYSGGRRRPGGSVTTQPPTANDAGADVPRVSPARRGPKFGASPDPSSPPFGCGPPPGDRGRAPC